MKIFGQKPEFFDIFGLITFSVLTYIGYISLTLHNPLLDWQNYFILVVGILGLIIDGTIVYRTYLK